MQPDHISDIAIIGQGPVGLITALALAQKTQYSLTIFGPKPTSETNAQDTRTTAFMLPSLDMLQNLGLWEQLSAHSAPLSALRMIDDCGGLMRAPDCYFSANELGKDAFAQNIPNKNLNTTLIKEIQNHPNITWVDTKAVTLIERHKEGHCDHVKIQTQEGNAYTCHLLIGADGRGSPSRKASGIKTKQWSYDQSAIACSFTHELPHNATSIEFHRSSGPLTLIPLKEHHASLVWSLSPHKAQQVISLDETAFAEKLYDTTQAIWGPITSVDKRVCFPISGLKVDKFAANRIALVGEAAHVIPPIGAQGLNLGLRDSACLVHALSDQNTLNQDLTNFEQRYNQSRLLDVHNRTTAIDLLNKSLLMSFLPLKIMRTAGLNLLNANKTLRNQLMQQGLGSTNNLPPLMQAQ